MSAGMPELGSKISLISKADIRYEGRLFTVDPQECTIALATVRSFGTEDRDTKYPVAPQNQVYDYILFRGSDIKDIRVVNTVIPNDPAIMQLSVPPSLGAQAYTQGFGGHPVLGPMAGAPQIGQYPVYGSNNASSLGPIGAGLPGGMTAGMSMQRGGGNGIQKQPGPSELIGNGGVVGGPLPTDLANIDQGVRSNDSGSVLDLISGGGSRSTTPVSLGSRKSPTNDAGVQVSGGGRSDQHSDKKSGSQKQPFQQNQQRVRRESGGRQNQNQTGQRNQQRNNMPHQQNTGGGYEGNRTPHPNQRQQHQQSGTGWINRGNNNMRSRGRGRGGPIGYRQQGNIGGTSGGKPKNTLKFDNDYDFEQANTEFEELRSQLGKVKIDDASNKTTEINGDVEKKEDSGNETGAGEGEVEEETEIFYDKQKSFFDNISCEAIERSKGRTQRTDWRTERKLNSETFGIPSARRGGFRGRGGYYNRGLSGGYRGGYRNNYRPNQSGQRSNQRQNQQGSNIQNQNSDGGQTQTSQPRPATVPAPTAASK